MFLQGTWLDIPSLTASLAWKIFIIHSFIHFEGCEQSPERNGDREREKAPPWGALMLQPFFHFSIR